GQLSFGRAGVFAATRGRTYRCFLLLSRGARGEFRATQARARNGSRSRARPRARSLALLVHRRQSERYRVWTSGRSPNDSCPNRVWGGGTTLRRRLDCTRSRTRGRDYFGKDKRPMSKALGIIPARWGSTRFPGKPLHLIAGKPLLRHVWEQCRHAKKLDQLIVATDDFRIAEAAFEWGAEVAMTSPNHASGTDRIAEVAAK